MTIEKLIGQVGADWATLLGPFMAAPEGTETEYDKISSYLKQEKDNNRPFFPAGREVFKAFKATPLTDVRVVLLGQDPYPKEGFANGLAFGTDNPKVPVSLATLYDGLEKDVFNGLDLSKPSRTGNLSSWANQGVLLLNTALTVSANSPGSHNELWKPFTEFVIKELNAVKRDLVWIGFGAQAKTFLEAVNPYRAFVFLAEHPAAAARAKPQREWKHNHVFTKCNFALRMNNLGDPITW